VCATPDPQSERANTNREVVNLMGRPLAACIVPLRNTYSDRAGNSAYLHSFVRALSEQGMRVGLALVDEIEEGVDRFHVSRQFLAPYSYIHARGYVRFGEWFVTTRPRRWLRRLRRFLPQKQPPPEIQTRPPTQTSAGPKKRGRSAPLKLSPRRKAARLRFGHVGKARASRKEANHSDEEVHEPYDGILR
jgi:hypothetical protein